MKEGEIKTARLAGSGLWATLLTIIGLAMLWSGMSATGDGNATTPGVVRGLEFPALPAGSATFAVATVCLLLSIAIMSLTSRIFNITHTSSRLYAGLFALMVCATPGAAGPHLTGMALCLTGLGCMILLYTTYNRANPYRRIFLIFAILSACSCYHWAFAALVPVMLPGCAQMRRFTLRTLLAALIGVITPLWILWGSSIISLDQLTAPHIALPSQQTLAMYSTPQLVAMGTTLAAAVVATLMNVIKVYGFNARTRSFNGLLAMLTLWTAIATVVDFGHAIDYMALLTALAAMQITLYYHLWFERRSYITVIAVTILFIIVFLWNANVRI